MKVEISKLAFPPHGRILRWPAFPINTFSAFPGKSHPFFISVIVVRKADSPIRVVAKNRKTPDILSRSHENFSGYFETVFILKYCLFCVMYRKFCYKIFFFMLYKKRFYKYLFYYISQLDASNYFI